MFTGGGTVVARYDYDPYGRSTTVLGATPTDFNFTGLYRHSKSNLDSAVYRACDPDLGRWLSRDPTAERGGINLYSYGSNNPANLTDQFGLCPGDWWDPRTWFNQGVTDSLSDTWTSLQDSTGDILTGNWDRLAADAARSPLGRAASRARYSVVLDPSGVSLPKL
jgi:RHS repeat-associated protein